MKYITISREYGAQGNYIGRAAAKELGLEFYDRDIIRGAAKITENDYESVKAAGESITRMDNFVRKITPISYDQKEYLFGVQKQVILDLAAKGPCFFLGRCADVILPEAGIEPLKIFIYADEEHRAAKVGEYLELTDREEILHQMRKTDRERRAFYEHYSHQTWGDMKNFHLALDSGALGFDTCVALICEAARRDG